MNTRNVILFVIFFIGVLAIGIIVEIFRTRCPKCRKLWARKINRTTRNYDNHRILSDKSHTHIKSISYCTCKFCGHQWEQKYTSTKRKK